MRVDSLNLRMGAIWNELVTAAHKQSVDRRSPVVVVVVVVKQQRSCHVLDELKVEPLGQRVQ